MKFVVEVEITDDSFGSVSINGPKLEYVGEVLSSGINVSGIDMTKEDNEVLNECDKIAWAFRNIVHIREMREE